MHFFLFLITSLKNCFSVQNLFDNFHHSHSLANVVSMTADNLLNAVTFILWNPLTFFGQPAYSESLLWETALAEESCNNTIQRLATYIYKIQA